MHPLLLDSAECDFLPSSTHCGEIYKETARPCLGGSVGWRSSLPTSRVHFPVRAHTSPTGGNPKMFVFLSFFLPFSPPFLSL